MPTATRRPVLRFMLRALAAGAVLLGLFGAWFFWQLNRSLPALDGQLALTGLASPVTVERDALGVPTIHAASHTDALRALGFLHAQDRFFQMDISRRRAAGELAALVGKGALPLDRATRIHAFRTVARASLAQLSAEERADLDAYTAGVNAGLAALRARPFEYLALRTTPAPWLSEDSLLVAYAMWLDLQDADAAYERTLSSLRDTLGQAFTDFFSPLIAPDDVTLDATTAPLPGIPGPRILDLRKRPPYERPETALADEPVESGSNSFALPGALTASGLPLLANDMHLSLRVPNTWYRASLDFPATPSSPASTPPGSSAPSSAFTLPPSQLTLPAARTRATGVTLPGIPAIIAGSNGHIAWGFTNSNADTVDAVTVLPSDLDKNYYLIGADVRPLEKRTETIHVKGDDPVTETILISPWGPIIGTNAKGQHLALKWIAHDPAATNLTLGELATATTVDDAIAIAHRAGLPAQNLLVADRTGAVAWTIAGKLPRRVGYDGRLPVTMTFGDRRWDGFVPAEQIPVLHATPAGLTSSTSELKLPPAGEARLFTANQRLLGGDALTVLGDGGYEPPLRAARIRQALAPLEKATPADLLAVQLDDRAPHLERWHALLLRTLSDDALAGNKPRTALRAALTPWDARATIESTAYRHVRAFRRHVTARALDPIFARAANKYPDFNLHRLRYEPALWRLLDEKPLHLLDSAYATWDELLLAAADDILTDLDEAGLTPAKATWGRANTARIQHPLGRILPGFLARLLDMPADPLPGDRDVPRVQTPTHGASERFVVSPGREDEGIFHMPGGQSGHPRSPFYRAGHDAWVQGEPTPFLPGPTQHTLTLTP